MIETWRPIPGFEGYEVSNAGRVRSYVQQGRWGNMTSTPTVRKPHVNKFGYYAINLGKYGAHRIHRLVLLAFVGPSSLVVRHLNGDPGDNRLQNLAYGTVRENMLDTVRHGRHPQASMTHCKRGHEFTGENTYIIQRANGASRQCRACEPSRRHEAKLRLAVEQGA